MSRRSQEHFRVALSREFRKPPLGLVLSSFAAASRSASAIGIARATMMITIVRVLGVSCVGLASNVGLTWSSGATA